MSASYKVTGIDPGDTSFYLGNRLRILRSPDAIGTPAMYGKVRGSGLGHMSPTDMLKNLKFFDELFSSDVVLEHAVSKPEQEKGDFAAGVILIATLLIAFPDARFGFGLQGGPQSLSLSGDYRSLGTHPVDLQARREDRMLVTRLYNYLRHNSYWVDDDLVHVLALLTDICQDRDRLNPRQCAKSLDFGQPPRRSRRVSRIPISGGTLGSGPRR